MSQLFTDLTSSPDSPKATSFGQPSDTLGMGPTASVSHRRWPLVLAAIVLPSVIAGSAFFLFHSQVEQPSAEAPVEAMTTAAVTEPVQTTELVYRILPYPSFTLKPLPVEKPELTVNAKDDPAELLSNMLKQTPEQQPSSGMEANDFDLDSLPPDLALKLKEALSDDKSRTADAKLARNQAKVIPFGDLPADAQLRFPKLDFQAHLYGSEKAARWVKVNGKEVREGQEIVPGVFLLGIEPNQVVLQFEDWLVTLPALATVG